MSTSPISGRPLVSIPAPTAMPAEPASKVPGGSMAWLLAGLPPSLPGLDPAGALAKPVLAGALGVAPDLLAGMAPVAVLASLLTQTRAQQLESRKDLISTALGVDSKAFQGAQSAADNYDVDIGAAIVKWASDPENAAQGFKFAAQVVTTIGTALATGGGSLIQDLPALAAAGVGIADDILKESGYSLKDVIGNVATDVLVQAGVDPEMAAKLGPFMATAAVAGMQAYTAYNTGDLSQLDPKVFGDLVQQGSSLLGVDAGMAGKLGTLTSGGMSLGLAVAGGNSEFLNSGNLEKLISSGQSIGANLQGLANGQSIDLRSMMAELGNFSSLFSAVTKDLEKDTGIPNFSQAVQSKLAESYESLGPFKDILNIGIQLLQQGVGQQRNMI